MPLINMILHLTQTTKRCQTKVNIGAERMVEVTVMMLNKWIRLSRRHWAMQRQPYSVQGGKDDDGLSSLAQEPDNRYSSSERYVFESYCASVSFCTTYRIGRRVSLA